MSIVLSSRPKGNAISVSGGSATGRALVVVMSLIVLVAVEMSNGEQLGCRQVAEVFESQRLTTEQRIPTERIDDADLEVCSAAAAGVPGLGKSKTCCTRHIERQLHGLAVEDARHVLTTLPVWRRFNDLEVLISALRGDLRQQLLATANTTSEVLATAYKIADAEFIVRMFSDLANYVHISSQSAETYDFRLPVARMLDSLFATVYFQHIAGSSGGGGSGAAGQQRSSSSSTSAHHRSQHFEQQQLYIECVASARRQLDPPPLNDLEVRLSDDFKRSFNVTRLMIDALDVAAETIRWTTGGSSVNTTTATGGEGSGSGSGWVAGLLRGHQCSRALTRMRRCAMCDGHADLSVVRPCRGFCLNVARGCLSPLVAGGGGLGQAWDLYVHVVSQVANGVRASYDIDRLLAGVPSYLSTEISVLLQTADNINHRQISSKCGHYASVHATAQRDSQTTNVGGHEDAHLPVTSLGIHRKQTPKVMGKFRQIAIMLTSMNEFYKRLPEAMCRLDGFGTSVSNMCWNGTAIDRYNQTISTMAVKSHVIVDNPEMRVVAEPPEEVAAVTHRLGNMTKLLLSRDPPKPVLGLHDLIDSSSDFSGDYDEYGFEGPPIDGEDEYGSGSGSGFSRDDEDFLLENQSSERPTKTSGHHPTVERTTPADVFFPSSSTSESTSTTKTPTTSRATTKHTTSSTSVMTTKKTTTTTTTSSPYITTKRQPEVQQKPIGSADVAFRRSTVVASLIVSVVVAIVVPTSIVGRLL